MLHFAHGNAGWWQGSSEAGLSSVGRSAQAGRATVRRGKYYGEGRSAAAGQSPERQSLVPAMEGGGSKGAAGGGARWPGSAAYGRATGESRLGAATGGTSLWVQHGSVDSSAGGAGHRAGDGSAVSSRTCVESPSVDEVVFATAGSASEGAKQGSGPPVDGRAVASRKKKLAGNKRGSHFRTKAASPSGPPSAAPGRRAAKLRS